jgi:electron transfer flavoprotein beta subunit
MKIIVPVKRVISYDEKIKVKPDGSGVVTDGVNWSLNPFDEIAVEEAAKLKKAGIAEEIIVVAVGGADVVTQLRYALARGGDKAIHVLHDGDIDSDLASRAIAAVCKRDECADYSLILMGKQAIDSDAGQTPQLLAARLGLPQASYASNITIEGASALVDREVDGGIETVRVSLPAVISADLRLNEPGILPIPAIMKAKSKPIEEVGIESLGVSPEVRVVCKKVTAPAQRSAGRKVASVEELVAALKSEARVI